MQIILGIGGLLAFGAVGVAVIAWLCSRASAWSRRAGVLLASIVVAYCGGVALILVIGSVDGRESPRFGGVLSVVTFALIASAALVGARRGLAKT